MNQHCQSRNTLPSVRAVRRRAGTILIGVLVCVAVTSAILTGIATSALRQRRQIRRELQMEQTRWLLEAGLVRASTQCRDNPDYSGETMKLLPVLTEQHDAVVKIQVSEPNGEKQTVTVTAIIRGNAQADQPTQRTGQFTVPAK